MCLNCLMIMVFLMANYSTLAEATWSINTENQTVSPDKRYNMDFWFNAVKTGIIAETSQFVNNKGFIENKNVKGQTTLMFALEDNRAEIIDLLIKNGAAVNNNDDNEGKTALFYAIEKNDLSLVKILHARGADINIKCNSGIAPLGIAAGNGNVEIADFLIACGAKINHQSKSGNTALGIAAVRLHYNVVKLLVDHYAAVNLVNEDKFSPLHAVLQVISTQETSKENRELGERIAYYLIEHGANVNAKLSNNSNPLIIATYGGNYEIVKRLISHGADINAVADYGYAALTAAVKYNHTECAKFLLEHGARISVKSNVYLYHPLIYAAMHKNLEMFKLLLKYGANPLNRDADGYTIRDCLEVSIHGNNNESDRRIFKEMLLLLDSYPDKEL